ncbi:hypothetical protein IFT66_06900 [Rhizobium sp. CFBP 13726]|uniref:hypothetical protein n=1 Tax=Rhizobium sp. CFBP 13726 TaxID=2775296 RepID=UPI00177ED554|nr:hypothetical protein [Rhizobium sp. CFBP 13726]MBD8650804.1 hypothetical protein [Rhizobium sp. CFBP 13726]
MSEAADLIGVPEMTLRTWLARVPFNDFTGIKKANRVFLSCQDAYFFLLVREMTRFGVPVRSAMHEARDIADAMDEALPNGERLVIRHGAGSHGFEIINDPDFTTDSGAILPLRSLAVGLIERAAVVYLEEAN